MARTGVSYNDIARAAIILNQLQKPITIDNIRELLGTGSKTTIARHLQKWKDVHSSLVGVKDKVKKIPRIHSFDYCAIDLDKVIAIVFLDDKKNPEMEIRFNNNTNLYLTEVSMIEYRNTVKAWTDYTNLRGNLDVARP